jgi:large subunit ribosomal protein L18
MATASKVLKRRVRQTRIRAKISGTPNAPRLSIFKSNKYIYAQLIDDSSGTTLAHSSGKSIKANTKTQTKTEQAKLVGADIAKQAVSKKVKEVVFDRGGYIYTGRIKALADAAREAGLKF